MAEKLVIGPFNKGLRNDVKPFNIDNDSFPTLVNAYQWRGRVLRKRGTSPLNRLQRNIGTTDGSGNFSVTIQPASLSTPIQTAISSFQIGTDYFVDPGTTANPGTQTLLTNGTATATLNRTTGVLSITGSQISSDVIYFPGLPVMGLEDRVTTSDAYPQNVSFDTTYAYNINTIIPNAVTDISFYKNPTTGTYANYVAKSTATPLWWNGQNYQQFWSTNSVGAFWATNGVTVPFTTANIGMQFKPIVTVDNINPGPPYRADLTITGHGLVKGDFVFVNEVSTTKGINWQTGYVSSNDPQNANKVTVTFPNAVITGNGSGGIAQYLTNSSDTTKDCLRWYDGTGWVNFCPPLSENPYPIDENTSAVYYLVGAKLILPFKNRLVFFGPVIQPSSGSATPIYLKDVIIYSQDGTPYYTSSFTNTPSATVDTPTSATNTFFPILVPANQTATAPAYFEDQTGFGGFQPADVDQEITTVAPNEDALILGFDNSLQMSMIFTGSDINPFNLFIINAEYGSGSTFSIITMDEGVLTRGPRGYITTNQRSCQRIDLDIPDQVFEVNYTNNGAERFCSQRDFRKEWIFFSYVGNNLNPSTIFPNQTLQYNYRNQTWAIFNESYTTYGTFRPSDGFTWATIGLKYQTWEDWNDTWASGASTPLNPFVIAGNQQGYVVYRDYGTQEAISLFISNIVSGVVTSPNHGLNNGDYIVISGCTGTISSVVNGNIYTVGNSTQNTFSLVPTPMPSTGTYTGGGMITKMYVPQIISKQFPLAWDLGRKTRLGTQQYLLTRTPLGQVTLLIFLSQDASTPYNNIEFPAPVQIVPSINSENNSLIYSTVIYTCPESTNLGLSPANINTVAKINLQEINLIDNSGNTANSQSQIWHRMNTSLLGDTVQFGITLSDTQMRDPNFNSQFEEIEFHGAILDVSPSGFLS